jgi:GT2 family glycosyltransferase
LNPPTPLLAVGNMSETIHQHGGEDLRSTSDLENLVEAERLTILLVNFNGKRYLGPCLDSIRLFAPSGTQVILVDNSSDDCSGDYVARDYPWVHLVRSGSNLGFARGNNLGGRQAQGKFILLLNTDTQLLEPIGPVVDWLESRKGYGALTINMVDGGRIPRACTGKFPSPLRLALLRLMLVPPEHYRSQEAYDVDWVQGSFLLIRHNLWRRLGGLDEQYFMYAEDVDLCKRIWEAGARCAYLPGTKYLHWGGFDSSRFPDQVRGLALYVTKHMTGMQRLVCKTVLLVGCMARIAFYEASRIIWNRKVDRIKADGCRRALNVLLEPSAIRTR